MGTAPGLRVDTLVPMSGNNESVNKGEVSAAPASQGTAYTIAEAARLLGIHYFSVYRLIKRGKLRACRGPYGKWFVTRSELLRLLRTK
jgi:excisionase family DNA binding protein